MKNFSAVLGVSMRPLRLSSRFNAENAEIRRGQGRLRRGAEYAAPFGRQRVWEGFEKEFINVTPTPILTRLEGFDEGMIG
jgi:hypothetical protein